MYVYIYIYIYTVEYRDYSLGVPPPQKKKYLRPLGTLSKPTLDQTRIGIGINKNLIRIKKTIYLRTRIKTKIALCAQGLAWCSSPDSGPVVRGPAVLWSPGPVVLWSLGPVVLWFSLVLKPCKYSKGQFFFDPYLILF